MSPRNAKKSAQDEQTRKHPEVDAAAADAGPRADTEAQAVEEATAAAEHGEGPAAGAGAEAERERPGGDRSNSEMDVLRDRHLRLAAEFDNYRKRTERERGESWTRAQAQLVERLLDPLDDLQRVIDVDAENTSVAALLEGVQLVQRKLMRVLEGAGLELIEAAGQPFDPEIHEALMMVPTDNPEEDHQVAEVFKTGYSFKGILLRPALVQVKKYEE